MSEGKITIVLPKLPPGQGGMERQAFLQAIELSKYMDVSMFSSSTDGNLFSGTPIQFYNTKPYFGRLAKEINAFRIFGSMLLNGVFFKRDILYLHQFNFLTFLTLLLCLLTRRRAFIKIANSGKNFDLKLFFNRLYPLKLFKKTFDSPLFTFLCLNTKNKDDFSKFGMKNVHLVPFRNGVISVHNKENIKNYKKIMYLGRLEPIKNVDYIFDLADLMNDFEFIVVGDGSCFEHLNSLSTRHGNVRLIGETTVENIPWSQIEWVILPSLAEGMSNVLLEALANQKGILCRPIEANLFLGAICEKLVWISDDQELTASKIRSLTGAPSIMNEGFSYFEIGSVVSDLRNIIAEDKRIGS